MKRLLAPALVLFVVGGVVAWYALASSIRAERAYAAWVHALADDETTRILESSFERGWLQSRAETSVEMSGAAGLAFRSFVTALGAVDVRERVGVHMVHDIEHGPAPLLRWLRGGMDGAPILARIRSTVEIDQESQIELAEALGKLPPVEAETLLRASGQGTTRLSVGSERLRARGEGFARDARFLGASGDLELRDGYRHVSGTIHAAGFAGRGLEHAVELGDATWLFELPGSALPVGRMELAVGELRVAPAEGEGGFALEDVLLEPSGRVSGGRLEADLLLRIGSLALGDEVYGPATIALDLRDLDVAALQRLRRAGLELDQGSGPVEMAVAGAVAGALPALLDRVPRVDLRELRLASPAGPIAARGRLALARPELSSGPLSFGSFFNVELEAEAPAAVAESILAALFTPASASELRAKGALAADGGRLRLHAEWRGGVLQLNGVPVALPAPAPAPAAAPASADAPAAAAAPEAAQASAEPGSDRAPAPGTQDAAAAAEAAPSEAASAPAAEPAPAAPAP